ncbi:hypothetical protein [Streptomyces sp. NPDC001530]|uniref:DUF7144 family membrane protein n=1 Tax=Streptomyces sp. NPDC001530 TaxID=3364582 RepID=UPI0036CDB0AB
MSQEASQPSGTPHGTGTGAQPTGEDRPLGGEQGQRAGKAPGEGGSGAPPSGRSAWATGGVTFAGVLMLVNGVLNVLQGIAAIVEDEVYARVDDYIYRINLTGWGWILVVLGVVVAVTGFGILKGADWARLTGIVLASLSIIFQFMFLPYAPLWGLIMIAVDFFVIWALAVYKPGAAQA